MCTRSQDIVKLLSCALTSRAVHAVHSNKLLPAICCTVCILELRLR